MPWVMVAKDAPLPTRLVERLEAGNEHIDVLVEPPGPDAPGFKVQK